MTVNKINTALELGFDVPALPGMAIKDIQTPCLILDMDNFDYNLKRMAELITPIMFHCEHTPKCTNLSILLDNS